MKTKQKPHKLLSLLLCCVMLVGMMPMTAAPAYAGGVTVINMNSGSGEGWSYDSSTKTLTLNSYNGTAPVSTDAATIVLNGINTINFSAPNESAHTGLSLIASSEATIKGNGSLTITVGGDSTNVNAGVHGINAQNKLSIDESASITITAYNKNAVYGIYAKEFANNSCGELKINVTTTDAQDIRGIELFNSGGSATFANGTTEITVSGNYPNTAYGIYSAPNSSGNIDISGGELKITMPNNGSGILMSKNGKICISGGETTITNASNGIFNGSAAGETDINITGGKLSITSEVSSSRGVYSQYNDVVISNAEVTINTTGNCICCGGSVNISGNSVVNITATDDDTPAMKGGNSQVHNFDLGAGGEITATGAHWYTIQPKITLGANTIAGEGTTKSSDSDNYYGTQESKPYTVKFVYQAPVVHPAKPTIDVTGTYTYTGSDITATVTGYDAATMNITGNTGKNAGNYTVSVTSKTGQWADGTTDAVTKAWSITKADPTYTVPTGLTGTKGNALSTVTLPSGWTWIDGTTAMSETGDKTFKAKFTPSDTTNYKTVDNVDVTITVSDIAPVLTPIDVPTATTGLEYTGSEQQGVPSGTGYALTGHKATNAGNYTATVTLQSGYEWADGTTDNKTIPWKIEQADPTYTVPTGLTGTKGNALSTVTLPSGWTWIDGTTVMSETGDKTFKAKFTPSDTTNYKTVDNVDVTITVSDIVPVLTPIDVPTATAGLVYNGSEQQGVPDGTGYTLTGHKATNAGTDYKATATLESGYKWNDGTTEAKEITWSIAKADPTVTVPTGLTGTKDNVLSTVTLPTGWAWKTPATVMNTTGNQTFAAIYTPTDTTNYNTKEVNLTVNVTATTPAPPAGGGGGGLIPAVQEPDITIIGSGKATLSTDGSTANITADEGYELVSITLNGKEIANTDKLTGLKTGDKVVVIFQKKSEEPTVDTKTIADKVGKMQMTARSSKTTKKNIRITVNTDKETNNLIKEIKDLGYTVKYKYYRSTKKASKYTSKVEKDADINSYINTSGKKGTKYYYKVRVMVYDAYGDLVAKSDLKQCKYASRTWSK